MKSRKTRDPLSGETSQHLIKELNATKQEWLQLFAKYFGDTLQPLKTQLVDLDSKGLLNIRKKVEYK